MIRRCAAPVLCLFALALDACGDPEETPRVDLPVVVDASGIETITNDLGYKVTLADARVMVENLTFTIAGEAHTASRWRQFVDFLVPSAYAHPGHFQRGDVTGELRGRFRLSWLGGSNLSLGTATLLVGTYKGANFTFAHATDDDGLATDDPLIGHAAVLRGSATKGAATIEFTVVIDSPKGRELIGAPFEFDVKETATERLGVRLLTKDPFEGDTLFDGIDFSVLDQDGDGLLTIGPDATDSSAVHAYNVLRRSFQTHDHYDIRASPPQ